MVYPPIQEFHLELEFLLKLMISSGVISVTQL